MFKSIRVGTAKSPVLVVGVFSDRTGLPRGLDATASVRRELTRARKTPGFAAKTGEIAPAGDRAFLVGLGDRKDLTRRKLREAAGAVVRRLDAIEARSARLRLADLPAAIGDGRAQGRVAGEAIGLANWRVDFFDGAATKRSKPRPALTLAADDAAFRAGLKEGLTVAECANEARRIAATPPNICNPAWIAKETRRLARDAGLRHRVISYEQANRLGMGGLVNVGKASRTKPCLVILEHRPARPRKGVRVALVGKTMTYDTGGYSLKISGSMKGMKYDGNGGCAVLGCMLALAALKVPVHTFALMPCAENMVSGDAYRPDDIITMHNGVSVEVTNTDAEGRLILGDALSYACREFEPTVIIDAATLTGGVVVALGSWCAGMFGNDDALCARIESAAEATGERVWRLPLWEDHRDFMRSEHADIWNSGPKRDGHPIQGAAFLSYFVDEKIPWAHLDIAGVSAVDSPSGLFVTGPTGFGVRLMTETVAGFA